MEGGTIRAFTKSNKDFSKSTALLTNAESSFEFKRPSTVIYSVKRFKLYLVYIAFDFKIFLTDFVKASIVLVSVNHIYKIVIWCFFLSGFDSLFAPIDKC